MLTQHLFGARLAQQPPSWPFVSLAAFESSLFLHMQTLKSLGKRRRHLAPKKQPKALFLGCLEVLLGRSIFAKEVVFKPLRETDNDMFPDSKSIQSIYPFTKSFNHRGSPALSIVTYLLHERGEGEK